MIPGNYSPPPNATAVQRANEYCQLLGIDPTGVEFVPGVDGELKSIDLITRQFETGELTADHLQTIANNQKQKEDKVKLVNNLGPLCKRNLREYLTNKILLALAVGTAPDPHHIAALRRAIEAVENSNLIDVAKSKTDPPAPPQ